MEESRTLRWLAAQPEFADAVAILTNGRTAGQDHHWSTARDHADVLYRAARSLETRQPGIARWLAEQSLRSYHAWMSQATSGGEGTAMQFEIRRELDDLRRLAGTRGV